MEVAESFTDKLALVQDTSGRLYLGKVITRDHENVALAQAREIDVPGFFTGPGLAGLGETDMTRPVPALLLGNVATVWGIEPKIAETVIGRWFRK